MGLKSGDPCLKRYISLMVNFNLTMTLHNLIRVYSLEESVDINGLRANLTDWIASVVVILAKFTSGRNGINPTN